MAATFRLSPPLTRKVAYEASRVGVSPQELVSRIVAEKMAAVTVPNEGDPSRCLDPACRKPVFGRGLCMRTYRRARYYMSQGILDEGWLVRHGRMLPARGCTTQDYASEGETLASLPGTPPDIMAETSWLFGFPQAQTERARMEAINATK